MRKLLIALTMLAACGSANHLREAQQDFSAAAALENKVRFWNSDRANSGAEAMRSVQIQNLYASVLLSLDKISASDKAQLQADGLWGSALSLRALTYWRLGQFDKALVTADQVTNEVGAQVLPRDGAMMAALPGLIRVDESNARHDEIKALRRQANRDAEITAKFERVVALTTDKESGAVAIIQRARDGLNDKDHPAHSYLIQSQLAAYRNYQSAYQMKNLDAVPAGDDATVAAQEQLAELKRVLALDPALSSANLDAIIGKWVQLARLTAP